jgi:hypothetical protein
VGSDGVSSASSAYAPPLTGAVTFMRSIAAGAVEVFEMTL